MQKIRNNQQDSMLEQMFGYKLEVEEPYPTPDWMKKKKPSYENIDTKRALNERGVSVEMDSRVMMIYTGSKVYENPFLVLQTLGFSFINEYTERGNIIFKSEAGVRYAFAGIVDNDGKMTIRMRNLRQAEENRTKKGEERKNEG